MSKQTAVKWLVEELNKSIGLTKFVDTCDEEYKQEILGIIEKALQREKEQIMDDFMAGQWAWKEHLDGKDKKDPALYYNKTFNTGDK